MFKKPHRVTVLRQLGGVGDLIMTTPVYRGLREKYGPTARITVATTWAYASGALPDLLKGNESISEVVRCEPMEWAGPMARENRWEFRNVQTEFVPECVRNADEVIELNVICAITETNEMLTPTGVQTHRTDIWCNHAKVNPSSKKPVLNLTPEELAAGRDWCDKNLGQGKRVGVVLKTMAPERNWPHTEQFIWDLKKQGYKVVQLDPMRKVTDELPSIIGFRIRPAAAVIAHLDAVVTPDTGLLHVAGALGVPILALFGSTHGGVRMREYAGHYVAPERVVPCAPCFYKYQCKLHKDPKEHIKCMKLLSPDLTLAQLEKLLQQYSRD